MPERRPAPEVNANPPVLCLGWEEDSRGGENSVEELRPIVHEGWKRRGCKVLVGLKLSFRMGDWLSTYLRIQGSDPRSLSLMLLLACLRPPVVKRSFYMSNALWE